MENSIWKETAQLPTFPPMEKEVKTDVLIIGGGLCGLLCARRLEEAGIQAIVVEKNRIASGVTKNTTAKITSQHGLIYSKIIKKYGTEMAKLYLMANEEAISDYRKIWHQCETVDAYTYSLDNRKKIEKETYAVQSLGYKADFVERTALPFPVSGAICFREQAVFHPLKFISHIAKNLNVYENTEVVEFTPQFVKTNRGRIYAKKVIVATHFPFLNKHGAYFLKLYQHRSYVSAAKNAVQLPGVYLDEKEGGLSFRNYNDILLIGSGGHRTGKKTDGWERGKQIIDTYFPKSEITNFWATQDCISLDGIPYIGQYGNTPNLYVATGFNKWGMTSSMVAANLLRDLILEKENPYEKLFSPKRTLLSKQIFINVIESFSGMIRPTKPRCPHLGCALRWNKQEHSWDCSCHGSRFSNEGKLLNNPATGDIKKP